MEVSLFVSDSRLPEQIDYDVDVCDICLRDDFFCRCHTRQEEKEDQPILHIHVESDEDQDECEVPAAESEREENFGDHHQAEDLHLFRFLLNRHKKFEYMTRNSEVGSWKRQKRNACKQWARHKGRFHREWTISDEMFAAFSLQELQLDWIYREDEFDEVEELQQIEYDMNLLSQSC